MKNSTVVAGGGAIDVCLSLTFLESDVQLSGVYGIMIKVFVTADGDKSVPVATCT